MEDLLKEIEDIMVELSYTNEHLGGLVSRIKSFDNNWIKSSCDTNIVFGLLGHKEHVDEKLHQLRSQLIILTKMVAKND